MLSAQYGDYGLPPKQSSFVMHAAVARHYFSGGSFPIGGSSRIATTVDKVIENAGGTILISAEVDEVIIDKNKATGVKMKDGKIFSAKNIISGAGIMTTYDKLLPKQIVGKHQLKEELKLPKTNYWIYPDKIDHDTAVDNYVKDLKSYFPVVYISFPSAKDPDWSNRYPGKSTIDIITLLPYEPFDKWKNSNWMKRDESYTAMKEKIAQRLLNELYKQLPHLEEKIEHYELSTPLTTKHFINYQEGEIYGLDHTPKRFRQRFLKPKTPIKNFYLTGQDIVTAGVAAALFSGVITTAAITRKNIIKKVMQR